jgi:3-isopropylmalate dehydrogenase
MDGKVAVLPGDGVGPEIVSEAVKVLRAVGEKCGRHFELTYGDLGGIAIDKYGTSLPDETLSICETSNAVLVGPIGGPKWDSPDSPVQPSRGGDLALWKKFDLFANLRPVKAYPELTGASKLRRKVIEGTDLIVLRESAGGVYFGEPKKQFSTAEGREAVDTMTYSEREIKRILRTGFELARRRRKHLTSADKANVLECSRLWRKVAMELESEYPDVTLEHMYSDACAMRLIQMPTHFDVIVTANLFGDILSDEASMLAGSLGMCPSACLPGLPASGETVFGLYSPIHGSVPARAGKGQINPVSGILSVALMLEYSFGLGREAKAIDEAVERVFLEGYRTYDVMEGSKTLIGTSEFGDKVAQFVRGVA